MVWSTLLWAAEVKGAIKPVRCAIYTRKSTEDGLEQEFNSLHAQREACEAYILSQRHEGWSLIPDAYDDGGFSGGSMVRPGLQKLLADIEVGKVDVIVVYKVDRLTRSLADFAKIVERLDEKQASFVSVTQAFNTTNSMGRLTLNVLLSFAQFEREVTGERIRDKIAASKKKGIWMGGSVPLGYVVQDRKLLVEVEEAERVRHIMRRYVACGSVPILLEQLKLEGVKTKIQQRTSGPHRGGIAFQRGSLFHLLKNPIYRGLIVHKGQIYPGEHDAIVDDNLWDAVQQRLAEKAPPRRHKVNQKQNGFLKKLLFDREGRPMVPSFTVKGLRRYCYYETRSDLTGEGKPKGQRFQMALLERHIISHMMELLEDQHRLRHLSGLHDGASLMRLFEYGAQWADALASNPADAVQKLMACITVQDDHLQVTIAASELAGSVNNTESWTIKLPLPTRKPFREARLVIGHVSPERNVVDPKLIALLRDAADVQSLVTASPDMALHRIAEQEKRCRKTMTQLLKLSWLSPRIVDAIMEGGQPKTFTRQRLMAIDLPAEWAQQERVLGFP